MIGVGLLGSGFIAESYADALLDVRNAELVACFSRNSKRSAAFAEKVEGHRPRHDGRRSAPIPAVEIVVVALPNEVHLEAVRDRRPAQARRSSAPSRSARTDKEAQEILDAANDAGVWHGYAESSVFSPNVAKAYEMVEAGGIGKLLTMRAREGHSGPHAPHFWDAETAGGGALLDMGCHTVESARHFFGKDNKVTEVLAWGATMVHQDKTTGEDTAVALLKFAGGQMATIESSLDRARRHAASPRIRRLARAARHRHLGRPGLGLHRESGGLHGREGRSGDRLGLSRARRDPRLRLLAADAAFHRPLRRRQAPSETFEDGVVVNRIIDACYRSMKTGQWEKVA